MLNKLRLLIAEVAQIVRRDSLAKAGPRGEWLAAKYLRRELGFRIIARNWRNPRDEREEIDLVVRDGEVLVFVEVKTRAASALVSGYHAVDDCKRDVLRRAIKAYLAGLRVKPLTVRFDIVEVALPAAGVVAPPVVRHFGNIQLFSQTWRT